MTDSTHDEPRRVLGVSAAGPELTDDAYVSLFSLLVRARLVGERLDALAEAGTIGFAPTALGDEAALLGAASALEPGDWVFPTHRDAVIGLARGVSVTALFEQAVGAGTTRGRATPGSVSDKAARVVAAGAPTAAHAAHAVGLAYAAKRDGAVVLVTLTEPMLEAGELHSALNFAGVMRAPVVFLARATGEVSPSAADRAVAYGLASARVDATDALAMRAVVRDARAHAASGAGAVIVEATGRGATDGGADDPVARLAAHLAGRAGLSDRLTALRTEERRAVDDAVTTATRLAPATAITAFDDVFATPPWHLIEQRDAAARSSTRN
ncbi:MAG: hypothetical protein IT374_11800 [Polyangiaceae bacterium]|nr:hypothetical protein [Polyangiaceae bacterium]